jgi:hypothetical protein
MSFMDSVCSLNSLQSCSSQLVSRSFYVLSSSLLLQKPCNNLFYFHSDQTLFGEDFYKITDQSITLQLIFGAICFGFGWGLSGV